MQDINKIIDELNDLPEERRQAKLDAIRAIIKARQAKKSDLSSDSSSSPLPSPRVKMKNGEKNKQDNAKKSGGSQGNSSSQSSNDESQTDSDNISGETSNSKGDDGNSSNGNDKNGEDGNSAGNEDSGKETGGKIDSKGKSGSDDESEKNKVPEDELNTDEDDVHGQGSKLDTNVIDVHRAISIAKDAIDRMKNNGTDQSTIDNLQQKIDEASKLTKNDIDKMSQDEVDKITDDLLNLSAKAAKATISKNTATRVKEIEKEFNDPKATRQLAHDEIKAKNIVKARNDAIKRYGGKYNASAEALKQNLYLTIKDQIQLVMQSLPSWAVPNRKAMMGIPILAPGVLQRLEKSQVLPSLDVYIDQSDSWTSSDIAKVKEFLSSLEDFEKKKLVKINLYYFANTVKTSPELARAEKGTAAWPFIVENIVGNKSKNVLIVSDEDLYDRAQPIYRLSKDLALDFGRKVELLHPVELHGYANAVSIAVNAHVVPGAVFWLWKSRDSKSSELMKYLYGIQGNKEFTMD